MKSQEEFSAKITSKNTIKTHFKKKLEIKSWLQDNKRMKNVLIISLFLLSLLSIVFYVEIKNIKMRNDKIAYQELLEIRKIQENNLNNMSVEDTTSQPLEKFSCLDEEANEYDYQYTESELKDIKNRSRSMVNEFYTMRTKNYVDFDGSDTSQFDIQISNIFRMPLEDIMVMYGIVHSTNKAYVYSNTQRDGNITMANIKYTIVYDIFDEKEAELVSYVQIREEDKIYYEKLILDWDKCRYSLRQIEKLDSFGVIEYKGDTHFIATEYTDINSKDYKYVVTAPDDHLYCSTGYYGSVLDSNSRCYLLKINVKDESDVEELYAFNDYVDNDTLKIDDKYFYYLEDLGFEEVRQVYYKVNLYTGVRTDLVKYNTGWSMYLLTEDLDYYADFCEQGDFSDEPNIVIGEKSIRIEFCGNGLMYSTGNGEYEFIAFSQDHISSIENGDFGDGSQIEYDPIKGLNTPDIVNVEIFGEEYTLNLHK